MAKKLHQPHHKIPTVAWNHWGKKKSDALFCTLEEINDKCNNNNFIADCDAIDFDDMVSARMHKNATVR